jgi:hypothetical protein
MIGGYADEPGYADVDPGYGTPGLVDPEEPGLVDPGYGNPGLVDPYEPGYADGGSGYGHPGLVDPGEPGLADPYDPGYGDTGYDEDTGVVDPGFREPEQPEPSIFDPDNAYQELGGESESYGDDTGTIW